MVERLLIVGLGSIGKRHARLAREILPDAEIVVLRHRACDDLTGTGIDRCVTHIDDALAFRPDAAVIASPATHHVGTAQRLANAGVHLLIEKPLATDSRGLPELIATCGGNGLILMTGYNLRFLPSLRHFRDLVQQCSVGEVFSVRAEIGQYLPSWRPDADYRTAVSANASLGGGALLELSHELDYLLWLFGTVEWVSAIQRTQSRLEIDVEDTAHVVLGFLPRGEARPIVAALSMDFIRHDTTRTCTVIGATGSLRWNGIAGTVERFAAGGSGWVTLFTHHPARDESYLAELRHFLACVTDGNAPEVSGVDGLAVVRIVEAARASSRSGTLTYLPDENRNVA